MTALMETLSNQTAIITEADTEVGLEVARILLRRGCRVLLTGRATQQLDALTRTHGAENILLMPMESGNVAALSSRIVKAAVERFGSVDKIFFCSRPMVKYNTETIKQDTLKKVWNDQIIGPFQLVKESLQELKKSKGAVVLLSSFECYKPDGFLQSLVSDSKVNFVRFAAQELKNQNIRFNAVSPYGVQTETNQRQSWSEWLYSSLFEPPLGRRATSAEVAELMTFAASGPLTSVTGNTLCIDGGISVTSPPSYSAILTLTARASNVIIEFQKSVLRLLRRN